jgi:hypothetical protein
LNFQEKQRGQFSDCKCRFVDVIVKVQQLFSVVKYHCLNHATMRNEKQLWMKTEAIKIHPVLSPGKFDLAYNVEKLLKSTQTRQTKIVGWLCLNFKIIKRYQILFK